MAEPVALVAAAVTTALGPDFPSTFRALVEGRRGISPIVRFDASAFGEIVAATLPEDGAPPTPEGPTRVVTPHGRLLEHVARRAHDEAALGPLPREALGLFAALPVVDSAPAALATAVAGSRTGAVGTDLDAFFGGAFRAIHPLWPLETLNNVALGQVAADLDVRGDNAVFASEADAGARAVAEAARAVARGELAAALVAGVADTVGPGALARARLRGVPGEVLGEGAGALVLEREGPARARGRTPVARLTGAGFAFGPSDLGPGPAADTILRAVRAALAEAERIADDVTLLLVEGIGVEEAFARRELFGRRGADVAVVAPAVALGHLRAAAPVVAVALAAGILATGTAPSTAHGRPRALRRGGVAVVLASGTSGGAAALVVEGVA